jgi:Peptidase A4 family
MTGVPSLRTLCGFAACAACAAGAPFAVSGGARARSGNERAGVLIPSSPREVLPLEGHTIHSTNWSGYAVISKRHRITAVTGSFVVPKVTGTAPFGFAATWMGVGGYNTRDLIQAGTAEDSNSGGLYGKQYFAWYELLPAGERQLHKCIGDPKCRVRPGNRISVAVREVGGNRWMISMTNSGHWHWSKSVSYSSSRSSAEWILEAPSIGSAQTNLAPVGTVHFGPTSRYTAAGAGHVIAGGHPVKIILTHEAKPSALAPDGQSFNDCAYRRSACPRP